MKSTIKLLESIQNSREKRNVEVSIWQIPAGEQYRYLRFEPYDNLENKNFDDMIKNYEKVGTIPSIDISEYDTIDDFLEATYIAGNDTVLFGYFEPPHKIRSLSVSDIIQVDNDYYYIDSTGFKKLN